MSIGLFTNYVMQYIDESTKILILFIFDMFAIFLILTITFNIIKKFFRKVFNLDDNFNRF